MNNEILEKIESIICESMSSEECRIKNGGTCKECVRDYIFKIYEINKESDN